jgi:hypothetical protein
MNTPTYESFAESLNSDFELHGDAAADTLKLVEVSERKLGSGHEEFSLTFRGPLDRPLEQSVFPVAHPTVGAFDIFLVPVKRDHEGVYYEAVFNRFTEPWGNASSDESKPA